ncbi:ESPR-type extended signal peptide-containing protein [Burkholderia stabilis]|uniref:ESPR-type extended signal peptide-containing protein n=1 Tax=Burkholderia stabilis TaxID=95485 RepID=UPI001F4A4899|nr:ESPR-type extended signal peptide-containing protein [Burkholderia stabilis]
MNKTYRNIWNAATCTWTAVAETAKSHSKGSARAARQAVVALALGGAAVGGAFAADACTAADGTSGSLDTAGMCQAPVSSKGARSIGTMAALDDAYIKVNGSTASSATTLNSIAIGNGAIAGSGGTTNTSQVAIGNAANAQGLSTVSIGSSSSANGDGAVAFGRASNANGTHATALGNQSSAQAQGAAAVGDAATVAAGATNSVAIGTQANVGANVTNSVALGAGSTATRNNAVSVGSTTQTRQITNLAAGTQNTDAVNLGQMNAALAPKVDDTYVKVGGTVAATASGNVANIAIGSGANAVSDPSNSPAVAMGWNSSANGAGAIALGSSSTASGSEAMALGLRATASANGAVVLGGDAAATGVNSVAIGTRSVADRDSTVSVGSSTLNRQIVNMAAGTQATDAVNVSQLEPVVTALGGGAAIDSTTGAVTGPKYDLANGGTQTTVGGALGELDKGLTTANTNITKNADDITTINNQLGDLSSGTIGIVQQANAGANITVGASNDGAAVDFKGTAGERKLIGVAAGDVSATSKEAVNGSQLHGVSESVAAAIGGTSQVNPDGSITAPSFTVGDGNGSTTTVHSVGDAVTNLDGRVTNNEGDIAKLADQIGSGTVGLVQQAGAGANLTVGASTDGAAVDFTGTAGERKLIGVAAGDVSATSKEAVNGSQLHGVSESVAAAIGGNASVNPDGTIKAPEFTVGDGKGGTTIVNNLGDAVTNLDGRVTSNEGDIAKIGDQLASGQIGLVQQDPSTSAITVGAATGGTTVNFAGTNGPRTLSGVANGVNDSDAVTIAQLKATGLIDYTGKEIAAVTYDDISLGSVTFGGSNGTVLHNVGPGLISASSMDAVNGSQLYDLQEKFAQQYGQLSGQMDDLTNRVGDLEAGGGSGGGVGPGTGGDGSLVIGDGSLASGENGSAVGQGAVASGDNSSAVGQGSVASGNNGSAVGQGSVASGDNGSAFGQGSVASGSNGTAIGQGSAASGSDSTAVGQGAVASGDKGTAIGQGSSATGNGSVAIGSGSVADRDNSVSVGSEGHERQITNVKAGTADTDAVNVGQMNQRFGETNRMINDVAKNAYAGVAAAMAMPNLTPSQPGKTVVAVGAANYKSGSAVAAGATYRTRDGKWLMNGAVSVTSTGDAGVRAQVGYEF